MPFCWLGQFRLQLDHGRPLSSHDNGSPNITSLQSKAYHGSRDDAEVLLRQKFSFDRPQRRLRDTVHRAHRSVQNIQTQANGAPLEKSHAEIDAASLPGLPLFPSCRKSSHVASTIEFVKSPSRLLAKSTIRQPEYSENMKDKGKQPLGWIWVAVRTQNDKKIYTQPGSSCSESRTSGRPASPLFVYVHRPPY